MLISYLPSTSSGNILNFLSISNATPWDNICDNGDVDLLATGRNLLQLTLEVLLKTQNDAVRLNCVGWYFFFLYFLNDSALRILHFVEDTDV